MKSAAPQEILKSHMGKAIQTIEDLDECSEQVATAAQLLLSAVESKNKIMLCGNGGSAANAQHLATELIGALSRSRAERPAIPAISLSSNSPAMTAIGNNYGFERIFSRQVEALGSKGDVLVAITTSGNSPNVLAAVQAAKQREMRVIGLTGATGGGLVPHCDVCVRIPSTDAFLVQEAHLFVQHVWVEFLENCLC